jgi:hypothetical protein
LSPFYFKGHDRELRSPAAKIQAALLPWTGRSQPARTLCQGVGLVRRVIHQTQGCFEALLEFWLDYVWRLVRDGGNSKVHRTALTVPGRARRRVVRPHLVQRRSVDVAAAKVVRRRALRSTDEGPHRGQNKGPSPGLNVTKLFTSEIYARSLPYSGAPKRCFNDSLLTNIIQLVTKIFKLRT